MSELEVPGATLHYESVGQGPLLLCISGANGTADIWRPLQQHLQSHFTVVAHDRRGFSRSYLSATVGQDYSHRLATDADDCLALIKHLSPNSPATVIGSSSGAIVALELLSRHPEAIRTLISHEPPAFHVLPDYDELSAAQQDIYDTYRTSGIPPALEKFGKLILAGPELAGLQSAFDPRHGPAIAANGMYWFERELMVYPFREFTEDVKEGGSLRTNREKLLLANGTLSNKDALQYRGNPALREKLGIEREVVHFSGAHLGYLTHAEAFAKELIEFLKQKDEYYVKL